MICNAVFLYRQVWRPPYLDGGLQIPVIKINIFIINSTIVLNVSSERYFVDLKIVKSVLRYIMKQDRLNSLSLSSIQNVLVRKLDSVILLIICQPKNVRGASINVFFNYPTESKMFPWTD